MALCALLFELQPVLPAARACGERSTEGGRVVEIEDCMGTPVSVGQMVGLSINF
uniref:hypothetical protein n=1 Tax=Rhodococcoides fascians TaxID=1828 RepID=UPI000A44436E|nr:hypothetical protein [Rhodococcus fascians]